MPHADPAARQAYNRDYKRANRDRYRRRQKSYDAAKHANERAAAFGVEGTLTPEDVEQVLSVGACHWCGVALGYFTTVIDHVVALAKGGPNTPANLVPSCDPCNSRKADGTHPDRWAGDFDRCVDCGRTSVAHAAAGRCRTCYWRLTKAVRR